MASMTDGVSKLWILRAVGGVSLSGFGSDREAALHLAYGATQELTDKAASLAAVDAFADELRAYIENDHAEPLPNWDPEKCTCHIRPPCGYCTDGNFAEQ